MFCQAPQCIDDHNQIGCFDPLVQFSTRTLL